MIEIRELVKTFDGFAALDGDEQDHKDRAYADRQNAEGNHAAIPPDCIKRISTVRIA